MRNVIALILGGGRGTRLYPLTKFRAKPAVPLGGKYRLIDIPISNCINSGCKRVYVLTQFLSVSLHAHIRETYRFDRFDNGFVELLAAQQTMDAGTDWYEGTADAVRKNLRYIEQRGIDHVMILSGDQLYRMDYRQMIQTHVDSGAGATIAALPVTTDAARQFGIMRLDDDGRVRGFVEKPKTDAELDTVRMEPSFFEERGLRAAGRECLASMGIYVFNRDLLVDVLNSTTYEDFGKEVFPAVIEKERVQAHLFDGYWEDIGTIKAFYESNLSLAEREPPFPLYAPQHPVFTRSRSLPPSLVDGASVRGSLIAEGCRIGHGAVIENSIIGLRCIIGENVTIRDSIIMGADIYETDEDEQKNRMAGVPNIGIGANSVIERAIVDKDCRIGQGVRIVNDRDLMEADGEDFVIRDGISVIVKESSLGDGWDLMSHCQDSEQPASVG